jgi:hypothetical protein
LKGCRPHALAALVILSGVAHAATYRAAVRWLPSPGRAAGYHVWVRPTSGTYGTPLDAGLPPPAADGSLGFTVDGLALGTSYAFAVSAYAASGLESPRSNEIVIASPTGSPTPACDPAACPDPGPCRRAACDPVGGCVAVPLPDETPCDAGDPCVAGLCAEGACEPRAPQPANVLAIGAVVFRPAGGAPRFVARATFVARAPLDPSTTSLAVELDAPDGTPLYRTALDGAKLRTGPGHRRFHWTAPPGTAGLRRVVVRLDGLVVHVLVIGRDPALARAAAAPRLGWVVRAGEACARDLDLACTPISRRHTRCR